MPGKGTPARFLALDPPRPPALPLGRAIRRFAKYLLVRYVLAGALVGVFWAANSLGERFGLLQPSLRAYESWVMFLARAMLVLATAFAARDVWGGTGTRDFVSGTAGAAVGLLLPVIALGNWSFLRMPPLLVFLACGCGALCAMVRMNYESQIQMLRRKKLQDIEDMRSAGRLWR